MSEDPIGYGGNKQPLEAITVAINYDFWTIKLYKKQKKLVIETLDYHSGPLVLTRDQLIDISRKMGLHVRKRNKAGGGSV
ncbi:MAG: hypothetical protein ACHQII_05560 [Bacteroidia bacterium]